MVRVASNLLRPRIRYVAETEPTHFGHGTLLVGFAASHEDERFFCRVVEPSEKFVVPDVLGFLHDWPPYVPSLCAAPEGGGTELPGKNLWLTMGTAGKFGIRKLPASP
jgi:hypothetical protein